MTYPCFPPGSYLLDELLFNRTGMNCIEFQEHLGITYQELIDLFAGKLVIDENLAEKLTVIGMSAKFWINLQQSFTECIHNGGTIE